MHAHVRVAPARAQAKFTLELSNPCDLFIGENILKRTQAAAGHVSDAGEGCRECRLNDAPFEAGDELPDKGTLHLTFCSTKPQDEITFSIELHLDQPEDKVMCQRLWERALTTPSDSWKSAELDGASSMSYDHVIVAKPCASKEAANAATSPSDSPAEDAPGGGDLLQRCRPLPCACVQPPRAPP